MSEREPEKKPQINLSIGSQEFELRRDNSELYSYLGSLAVWNHVFVTSVEEDEVKTGTFIPRELIGHEPFDKMASAMIQHAYPVRLNQRQVVESDAEIITKILAGNDVDKLDEERPDWLQ